MSYNPAGGQTYTLQSSISSTQTTITLSSVTVPVSGDNITMALMNTDIAYATIAPKTSSSEFISFTGITQNSDGTATLTGVTRGLNKTYPFAENTDFKLPHSGQSTFILSNAPQVFNSYAALDNDNVFTGQNEVPIPLDDADIANKGYVDALVNGGTVSNNRIVVAGVAGETISIGNLVYLKSSDGYWWKTDADTASTINDVQLGIAQGAGTASANITGGILLEGLDTNNTGTGGSFAYASNTAGSIGTTSGTNPRVVGQFLPSLAGLYFNPNFQNIVTSYSADAGGTDAYAVTLPQAYNAYFAGMVVVFKANTINTGASTLNVNGLGAKNITKKYNATLNDGDILANQVVTVVYDGTQFQMQGVNVYPTNIQTFTSSGTWTKPSGAIAVDIICIGAGGGGGRANTSSGNAGGGGGGGFTRKLVNASLLSSTETVTVGTGGPGASANNTSGTAGGESTFGAFVRAAGGSPGTPTAGGAGGNGVGAGSSANTAASLGGAGGATGDAVTGGAANNFGAGGGASGGASTGISGGVGGAQAYRGTTIAGGTAGAGAGGSGTGGAGGTPTALTSSEPYPGAGGGGGGGTGGGTGGAGGAGGTYGGGGGGGGSGTTSGNGGAGADGIVVAITYF